MNALINNALFFSHMHDKKPLKTQKSAGLSWLMYFFLFRVIPFIEIIRIKCDINGLLLLLLAHISCTTEWCGLKTFSRPKRQSGPSVQSHSNRKREEEMLLKYIFPYYYIRICSRHRYGLILHETAEIKHLGTIWHLWNQSFNHVSKHFK